jgi:hypothetical protein
MKLGVLGACVLAGCGFSPQAGSSVDARAQVHDDAPLQGVDAHVVQAPDAKVWLDATASAPFDVTACPAEYTNTTISASPNSRYKLVTTLRKLADQLPLCDVDHPGWTHLFVPDTLLEAQQITSHMSSIFYVGVVQPKDQATVTANWVLYTGETVPSVLWSAGQPNDNADGVENNEQNFAAIETTSGTLNDVDSSYLFAAVCECDGKAIPANVAAMIAQ